MRLLVDVIEWERLLHDTLQHAGQAQTNLHDLTPGHPTTSPGNGEPGGGSNHGDSIVHRLAEQGLERDLIWRNLIDLERASTATATLGERLITNVTGQQPVRPPTGTIRQLRYARDAVYVVKHYLEQPRNFGLIARFTPREQMTRACHKAYAISYTWSRPTEQRQENPNSAELLALDLTEMWCRSCLRAGWHNPRHRRDLCRWCYTFEQTEGFIPPRRIVIARSEGRTITERDIAPLRQAHRQRKPRTA